MPPTATLEDIKAYQGRVEKGEIRPDDLPDCQKCGLPARYFKNHAYRERRFLIIVDMKVQGVSATLVRFRCTGCQLTMSYYPDFALPYKQYTRQSIMGFVDRYVSSDDITWQQSVMDPDQHAVPGYPDGDRSLAPSTVFRWSESLADLFFTRRTALDLIRQEDPVIPIHRALAGLTVAPCRYRKPERREVLLGCMALLEVEAVFRDTFQLSIFTKLAIRCAFT